MAQAEGSSDRTEGNALRAALDSAPQGYSVWDDEHRLVFFNQRYLDIYRFAPGTVRQGMTLAELSGLTVAVGNYPGMTADQLLARNLERFDAIRGGGPPLVSDKPVRGRLIRTSHSYTPGVGWVVIHDDVTDEIEHQWMADLQEKNLTTQSRRFEAALTNMPHGLSMYDAEGRLVICNDRYKQMYAMPEELCRPGTPFEDVAAVRKASGLVDIPGSDEFVSAVIEQGTAKNETVEAIRLPDGRIIAIRQAPMENGGFVRIHEDISAQVARFEKLRRAEAEAADQNRVLTRQNLRFDAAINNMTQGLCMFDKSEQLVVCNQRYAQIYNLPPELMRAGTTLGEIVAYRFAHGMVPISGRDQYLAGRKRLVTDGIEATDEIELEDGRTISIHHQPMPDGGWVATHEDVSEQRRIEARVRHLARHDALTDLPNRVYLREETRRIEGAIEREETVAVLCLDLDRFKDVNDTLGHGIGDQVLVTVANRLRACSREMDVVARLGGDEFAVLIPALEDPRDAATIAERVIRSVSEPMEIDGHQVAIGTSVGIALSPGDGSSIETLLKNADMALYRSKGEGRGNFHFFERGMDEALQHRRLLEQGLKVALARGELRLMYQPLVDLGSNRICCFEALLRWDHPQRGVISPTEFIPVAEESGLISSIGEWVLREACRVAAGWPDDIRVAVNLSPAQFKSRGLVGHVTRALAEAGLAAHRLELEVTESLLLADTEQTLETLHRLHGLGIRISMDDFGTGYSSLSYLRAFPFDKIKIDRSFIAGLAPGDGSAAIIRAVIGLGQSLGMATTAEGIETEAQLKAVREQGCNEVQGFLFSPPLPASSIPALLGRPMPHAPEDMPVPARA
ncbi:MAG: PAS-domain containing protein [Devosia sp.]